MAREKDYMGTNHNEFTTYRKGGETHLDTPGQPLRLVRTRSTPLSAEEIAYFKTREDELERRRVNAENFRKHQQQISEKWRVFLAERGFNRRADA